MLSSKNIFHLFFVYCNFHFTVAKFGDPVYEFLLYSDLIKCDFSIKEHSTDMSRIRFNIIDYTDNSDTIYNLDAAANSLISHNKINNDGNIVIYFPGFGNDVTSILTKNMIKFYRDLNNTYFYVLDAIDYLNDDEINLLNRLSLYKQAAENTYHIGYATAIFLKKLYQGGINMDNVHLVGHSLGAQSVGYAARFYYKWTGYKLKRVTGIDPAGPCFSKASLENQLNANDAEFVDIYHCNAGQLGTANALGTVDFFPDGGKLLNSCDMINGILESAESSFCSHTGCLHLWGESMLNPAAFYGRECRNWEDFQKGLCSVKRTVIAGLHTPATAKGFYYFSTNKNLPYGKGLNGV